MKSSKTLAMGLVLSTVGLTGCASSTGQWTENFFHQDPITKEQHLKDSAVYGAGAGAVALALCHFALDTKPGLTLLCGAGGATAGAIYGHQQDKELTAEFESQAKILSEGNALTEKAKGGLKVHLPDLSFGMNGYTLSPEAKKSIKATALIAIELDTKVTVDGYASSDGSKSANDLLSLKRAEATRAELVKQGVPLSDISVSARGESSKGRTVTMSLSKK